MFVQLSSHLHHHPHRTSQIKVSAVITPPAGQAGDVGSKGLFVMKSLCSVLWNMEFNSRSKWTVDIVLMVCVNNAGRLYFHYSFAVADFTFCVIMKLKNQPSLHGNEIHWENHIFIFLIINSLFFFFSFFFLASVKVGSTWTPADVHAAAVDSCVFIINDKMCFLLDFQADLYSTAARITVPGGFQHSEYCI